MEYWRLADGALKTVAISLDRRYPQPINLPVLLGT
jgi:hypothetical protein